MIAPAVNSSACFSTTRAHAAPYWPARKFTRAKFPGQIERRVYTSLGGILPAMPYCPRCLTEYVKGTTTCEDCGVQLAPGSPPDTPPQTHSAGSGDSKLVNVRVFTGPTALLDADVA